MAGIRRTIGPVHFEDLEPKRFEDLVRQLIYDYRAWRVLEPTGRTGSDDGFDVRGFEIVGTPVESSVGDDENREDVLPPEPGAERQWLIQCKREQRISPALLRKHLEAIKEAERRGLYGIVFVAACEFSKKARDVFRSWCAEQGFSECYLWGKADIEDLLFQPKNDHLLFAYFGVSLQIRRRSLRTSLRSRLIMKRKAERALGSDEGEHKTVLLRDPSEDRYPYAPPEADRKTDPMRWRAATFIGQHPWGIEIEEKRYFAYLTDDGEHWDYIEAVNLADPPEWENHWADRKKDEREEWRIRLFWDNLPSKNKAWFVRRFIIKYDEIFDIDPIGDSFASYPHVYVDLATIDWPILEFFDVYHEGRRAKPDPAKRIKFFPDAFPDPEKVILGDAPETPLRAP